MSSPQPSTTSRLYAAALREKGWTPDPAGPELLEFDLPNRPAALTATLTRKADERLALVDAAGPGHTPAPGESPSALFERYLDLSRLERFALWALAGKCDLLLCLTRDGATLLDADREIALGRSQAAASPDEASASLQVLETDPSQRPAADLERLGDDLLHWFNLACGTLGPVLKWARPDVERLVRQILLGVKTLVRTRPKRFAANLSRIGIELARQAGSTRVAWRVPSTADFLNEVLSCAAEFAPQGAGAFGDLERRALMRQAGDPGDPVARVLRETLQIAAVKLRAALQIRILPNTEQEHASWRLALTEPLSVAEEMQSQDLYVFEPLRLDLAQCGFGRLLEAIEKLAVSALARNGEIRRAGGHQLDLVESDPDAIGDPFNWLCRHALRVRVADSYRDAVGYLVASFVLDLRTRDEFRDCRLAPLVSLPAIFEPA
ncbi:hypothetical protein JW916_08055 [Candidatus Sumerlaeota bacterium]|nr:hypothetical protein [Candidatus Sumerlaeota bacterium]